MGRSSTSLRVLWDSLVKMHFKSDFTNITLKISSPNLKLAGLVLEPPGPYCTRISKKGLEYESFEYESRLDTALQKNREFGTSNYIDRKSNGVFASPAK